MSMRVGIVGGSWAGIKMAATVARMRGASHITILSDTRCFPGGAGRNNQKTCHVSALFYAIWIALESEAKAKADRLRYDAGRLLREIDAARARVSARPGALVCLSNQGAEYAESRIRLVTGDAPQRWAGNFVVAPGAAAPHTVFQTTDVVYDAGLLAKFLCQKLVGSGCVIRMGVTVKSIESDGRMEWTRTAADEAIVEWTRSGSDTVEASTGEEKFDLVLVAAGYGSAAITGSWIDRSIVNLDVFHAGVLSAAGHVSHYPSAPVSYTWRDGGQSLFTSQMHSQLGGYPSIQYDVVTTFALTDWTEKVSNAEPLPSRVSRAQANELYDAARRDFGDGHLKAIRDVCGALSLKSCFKINGSIGTAGARNTDVTFARVSENVYLGLLGKASHAEALADAVGSFLQSAIGAQSTLDWRELDAREVGSLSRSRNLKPSRQVTGSRDEDSAHKISRKLYIGNFSPNPSIRTIDELSVEDDLALAAIYNEIMAQAAERRPTNHRRAIESSQ